MLSAVLISERKRSDGKLRQRLLQTGVTASDSELTVAVATLLPVIMTVIPTKDKDFGASDLPNNPSRCFRGLPSQARDSGSRGSLSGALQERKLEAPPGAGS